MSDEHGWPDFAHQDDPGHHDGPGLHDPGTHDAGSHDDPLGGPFHDDLFDHDDAHDVPGGGPGDLPDDPGLHDDGFHDAGLHDAGLPDQVHGHDEVTGHDDVPVADGHVMGPVGADPDAAPEMEQLSVFPPVVDVGPLPEPVDGFPWIDTGSLGLYHSGLDVTALAGAAPTEPVPAADLAAYAAEDLPPGVDPWAALADSDDPATSALARWWAPGT